MIDPTIAFIIYMVGVVCGVGGMVYSTWYRARMNKQEKENYKHSSKHKCTIHNHPILERKLGVPEDHVIIDADLYFKLLGKKYDL